MIVSDKKNLGSTDHLSHYMHDNYTNKMGKRRRGGWNGEEMMERGN